MTRINKSIHTPHLMIIASWLACTLAGFSAQHWIGTGPRVADWTDSAPASRVRIGVRDAGVYRVTAEEIARASGQPLTSVLDALSQTGLALRCGAKEIAWKADGSALFFYGQPTTELFAPENVYWLSLGNGKAAAAADAAPVAGQPTNQWFQSAYSTRRDFLAPIDSKDRRSSQGMNTNVSNYGRWVQASSTEALRTRNFTVTLPGFACTQATGLTARVSAVSYYDFTAPDSHVCEIWLNGTRAGTNGWTGEKSVIFDRALAAGAATNGTVAVKVRNGLVATSADFLLLDVCLLYPRAYTAQEGALLCSGGQAPNASVGGFASPLVRVLDITDPANAAERVPAVAQDGDGAWRATFACGRGDAQYAVYDATCGFFEPSVSGVRDTDWSDGQEMPELAIIIPPRRWATGFDAALQPLVDLRAAQGVRTRVIDAEEIYNVFSDGLVHPGAFQAFSRAGVTNASLRYMLFAGHAGSDYKLEAFPLDKPTRFPNYFPLYLLGVKQVSACAVLMLPNDLVLGNADADPAPEVAVGRFIATNACDLANMVAKTINYERTETWKRRALVTSSYPDGPLDFIGAASTASNLLAGGTWNVQQYKPASSSLRYLWNSLTEPSCVLNDLRSGAGFLYYIGHANDTIAGPNTSSAMISSSDLLSADWAFAPVALMVGCRAGRWTTLDVRAQPQFSLAEAGFHHPTSGFTAVLAATGYLQDDDAFGFSQAFSSQVAAGCLRLGDAWLGAIQSMPDIAFISLQNLTFLGDPSLVINCNETGWGTPTDWLLSQGLAGDPLADEGDPDGDGFTTWQEYQAGTPPKDGGLKIMLTVVAGAAQSGVQAAQQAALLSSEPVMSLSFTPAAGIQYDVLTSENLGSGSWERTPWRAPGEIEWHSEAISSDWPMKEVEVPAPAGSASRFFKIQQREP